MGFYWKARAKEQPTVCSLHSILNANQHLNLDMPFVTWSVSNSLNFWMLAYPLPLIGSAARSRRGELGCVYVCIYIYRE